MLLAHEYRIKGNKQIEKVKAEGKLIKSENFGVITLQRNDKELPQFAFVISAKISKLAVHRNRIKRSMNEGVRRNLLTIPKGYDFVFLAKKSISNKTTEEIIREVQNFITKFKNK